HSREAGPQFTFANAPTPPKASRQATPATFSPRDNDFFKFTISNYQNLLLTLHPNNSLSSTIWQSN
ncbi:MAG: hypothetical protein K2J06_08600, partial [Muribaculaceae bacterium]|nr:hypothetical protein [Muribaculaceae bacterium]